MDASITPLSLLALRYTSRAGSQAGKAPQDGSVQVFGFSSPHGPQGPHHHVGVGAAAAAQAPADKSLDRVEQLNQQHQQAQQQAQSQSMETPAQGGPKMTL